MLLWVVLTRYGQCSDPQLVHGEVADNGAAGAAVNGCPGKDTVAGSGLEGDSADGDTVAADGCAARVVDLAVVVSEGIA
jgi:hypothetical protein